MDEHGIESEAETVLAFGPRTVHNELRLRAVVIPGSVSIVASDGAESADGESRPATEQTLRAVGSRDAKKLRAEFFIKANWLDARVVEGVADVGVDNEIRRDRVDA